MNNSAKNTLVSLLALSLLIIGTSVVSAQDAAELPGKIFKQRPELTSEQKEEVKAHFDTIKEAIENGDFETWRNEIAPKATFDALVEAHKLREAGDEEGARKVLEEAGVHPHMFGMHNRGGLGVGGPHMMFRGGGENHEAVMEAIENGDFAAWKEAMSEFPNAEEIVTEENFNDMVKMHELKESGDKEGLRELRRERLRR